MKTTASSQMVLEIAREKQRVELEQARSLLELLVREAYPELAKRCLCSRCLRRVLHAVERSAICDS